MSRSVLKQISALIDSRYLRLPHPTSGNVGRRDLKYHFITCFSVLTSSLFLFLFLFLLMTQLGHGDQREDMDAPLLASDSFVLDLRPAYSNTTSQVALVGAEVSPIESLDYEVVENDLFKQDWRARSRAHIFQYALLKWALCFLIGALAGGTGFLTNLAIENLAGMKFVVTSNMMLAKR